MDDRSESACLHVSRVCLFMSVTMSEQCCPKVVTGPSMAKSCTQMPGPTWQNHPYGGLDRAEAGSGRDFCACAQKGENSFSLQFQLVSSTIFWFADWAETVLEKDGHHQSTLFACGDKSLGRDVGGMTSSSQEQACSQNSVSCLASCQNRLDLSFKEDMQTSVTQVTPCEKRNHFVEVVSCLLITLSLDSWARGASSVCVHAHTAHTWVIGLVGSRF